MAEDTPQIYLITPRRIALQDFPDTLARMLDETEIACVRLALDLQDEDEVARAADAVRPICHARDVALVIEDHYKLVRRLGLDGVHLTGPQKLRDIRKDLGPDPIVGCYCGASRHEGLTAGEIGATYVSFGPLTGGSLGTEDPAPLDLFQWWSEMIEVPVVAERGLTADMIASLRNCVDFIALGPEIWAAEGDPSRALSTLIAGQ